MSIFDQRIAKQGDDIFYFQLRPTAITLNDEWSGKFERLSSIKFTLYKDEKLCDQVKKHIPVVVINGSIQISGAYLSFNISGKEQNNMKQLMIKMEGVTKEEEPVQAQRQESYEENRKIECSKQCLYEIASGSFKPNTYVSKYQKSNIMQFNEDCKLNSGLNLKFSLYVAHSRLVLQRHIRKTYEFLKDDLNNINIKENLVSQLAADNKIFQIGWQERENLGIFLSNNKRIIQERKLIVRNYQSAKKKWCSCVKQENERGRNMKSADKSYLKIKLEESESKKDFNKNSQKISKNQLNLMLSSKMAENGNNFLKVCQTSFEQSKTKNNISLRTTNKTQCEQQSKSPRSGRSTKSQKSNTSESKPPTSLQQNISIDTHNGQKQESKTRQLISRISISEILNSRIFLVGFLILSGILLVKIMIPTRKV